jgi:hypothetical protein
MPTVLGDIVKNREEVRRLLGNPPLSEVSDEIIDSALEKACSSISTDTGRNWSSSDRQWHDVVYTQNIRAAYYIMQFFPSKMIENKAKLLLEEYYNRIRSINRGQNDSTPVTFTIKSSKYKSRMLRNEENRNL